MGLQIEHLKLNYSIKQVLRDLNLSLENGNIIGLVGINGSGKTSLLRCLAGLLKPDAGNINFNGQSIKNYQVSFLETSLFAYPSMTGRDYLELFAHQNRSFRIEDWSRLLEIPLDGYISSYSSGMQKKLGLIGIIAQDREIMLLDEPFNALDLESVELLKKLLPKLCTREKLLLITSHMIETLTETCSSILYLQDGQITSRFNKQEYAQLKNLIQKHHGERYDTQLKTLIGS